MSKLMNRFNGWVGVVAFSCVVLGTIVEDVPRSARGQKDNYVIACCAIAIAFGFTAVLGHLFASSFFKKTLEGAKGVVVCALWAAALAIIHNPRNELALQEIPEFQRVFIRNANLYFFSWASFISSVYVLLSLAQEHEVVNAHLVPMKLMRWYLLLISSIVVLGQSSKQKSLTCASTYGFQEELCRRTDYAVALGVIGAALTVIPITLAHLGTLKLFVEVPIATISLVFYSVGVATITGNQNGPGNTIGNLYFFSWAAFGLSVLLTCSSVKEMLAPEEESISGEAESNIGKSETKEGKGENVVRQNVGQGAEEVPVEGESGAA